jgi:hypothetical protein
VSLLLEGQAVVVVAVELPEAGRSSAMTSSWRRNFADFQKYRLGTSRRSGQPWSFSSGLAAVAVGDEDVVGHERLERTFVV